MSGIQGQLKAYAPGQTLGNRPPGRTLEERILDVLAGDVWLSEPRAKGLYTGRVMAALDVAPMSAERAEAEQAMDEMARRGVLRAEFGRKDRERRWFVVRQA